MRLIAHRGASATHPENTCAAFDAALAAGADGFECDLRLSADGVVVCHDADLRRFGGPRTPLLRQLDATLRRRDVGGWKHRRFRGEPIPTLMQLLERYRGRCDLLLEVKPPRDAKRRGELVRTVCAALRQGGHQRCFLLCFELPVLTQAHRLLPDLPLVWNCGAAPQELARARRLGVGTIDCALDRLTPADGQRLRAAGFTVAAYSADDARALAHARACGVTVLMTNDPKRMRRLIPRSTALG